MGKVGIIGATTWGKSLGGLLANKGITVSVWARSSARAEELERQRQDLLSEASLPDCLSFTSRVDEALRSAEFVIWAVPAQSMRQTVRDVGHHLTGAVVLVSVAKGLEAGTGARMSQIIGEEIPRGSPEVVCALSGPNLSREIDQGLPATSVVAGQEMETANRVRELLDSSGFSVFISDDIIGVELCGALKNVIALGAGMLDGLSLGNNAKAAFITIAWGEIVSLGAALGARAATFYGLAGLGDLIATGNSPLSRNHHVGCELGKGRSLSEITGSMSGVAEGIDTAIGARRLAEGLRLDVPVIGMISSVLSESLSPTQISERLRSRLRSQSTT